MTDLHTIAARNRAESAINCIERIKKYCHGLAIFPGRGPKRDDLRVGLRILGFERRAVIAHYVSADKVMTLRVLYGGRELETIFV